MAILIETFSLRGEEENRQGSLGVQDRESGFMSANLIAIDVGPEYSAVVRLESSGIGFHHWGLNEDILYKIRGEVKFGTVFILESPQAQNRPLGKLLRDTIFWAGRFAQVVYSAGRTLIEADEREVREYLTRARTSSNAALSQSLKDHFGDKREIPCLVCNGTGRAMGVKAGKTRKCEACKGSGIVKLDGPLKGLNEHERSALACAVWYQKRFTEGAGA